MPSRKDCFDDIARKSGRPRKDVDELAQAIDARAGQYQKEGMSAGRAYARARDEELANLSQEAARNRRRAIEDGLKAAQWRRDAAQIDHDIAALPAWKRLKLKTRSAWLSLEALTVGTNSIPVRKGMASIAADYVGISREHIGGLADDLRKAGLLKIFASRLIEKEWARELWHVNKTPSPAWQRAKDAGEAGERELSELTQRGQGPGTPGVTKNAQALAIAKIVHKWQKTSIRAQNAAGADVRSYSGYITKQTHDADKIERAGQEAWVNFVANHPKFDALRTFGTRDRERVRDGLAAMYGPFAAGDHFDHGKPIDEPLYPNPAKAASAPRELHWLDGDGWLDYNQKFGLHTPSHTVVHALDLGARRTALMTRLGSQPKKAFDAHKEAKLAELNQQADGMSATLRKLETARDSAAAGSKEAGDLARQMESLAAELGDVRARRKYFADNTYALDNRFAQIDGTSLRPVNRVGMSVLNGWMSIKRMAALGHLFTTHIASLISIPMDMRYWGIPLTQRYASLFGAFLPAAEGSVRRKVLETTLVGADHQMRSVMNQFDVQDAPAGALTRLHDAFMSLTGINWLLVRHRSNYEAMVAAYAGASRGTEWAKLDPELARVLQLYDIGEKEWRALNGVEWSEPGDGNRYLFPTDARKLSDDQVRAYIKDARVMSSAVPSEDDIYRARESLARRLAMAYADRSSFAVPMPSARTRAIMFQGAYAPGSPLNAALRLLYQFKQWPIDIMTRVWGREMYGRIGDGRLGRMSAMIELAVGAAVFGMFGEGLAQLTKGQDPIARMKAHPIGALLQGMQRSGMGAIIGDYLLGQFDRHGASAAADLTGPTIGQLDDVLEFAWAGQQGERYGSLSKQAWHERGAIALKMAKDNTPFMNYFATQWITDALFWHRLQEWISPGYLQRVEQRQKQLQGTQFWLSPAKTDQWITGKRASPL